MCNKIVIFTISMSININLVHNSLLILDCFFFLWNTTLWYILHHLINDSILLSRLINCITWRNYCIILIFFLLLHLQSLKVPFYFETLNRKLLITVALPWRGSVTPSWNRPEQRRRGGDGLGKSSSSWTRYPR